MQVCSLWITTSLKNWIQSSCIICHTNTVSSCISYVIGCWFSYIFWRNTILSFISRHFQNLNWLFPFQFSHRPQQTGSWRFPLPGKSGLCGVSVSENFGLVRLPLDEWCHFHRRRLGFLKLKIGWMIVSDETYRWLLNLATLHSFFHSSGYSNWEYNSLSSKFIPKYWI